MIPSWQQYKINNTATATHARDRASYNVMTIITIIPVITIRSVVDGMAVIVAMIVPDLKILDWGGGGYLCNATFLGCYNISCSYE